MALGGGTARAMAHVGVLEAMEEFGITPEGAAGTSFGAIVAAAWALGMGLPEVRRRLLRPGSREVWMQAIDFGLHKASLVHGLKLERWLDRTVFEGATFADVRHPLVIATTSLIDGELFLVRDGSLARACVASCSLPVLFAPVIVEGVPVVDGGFVEAVPFRAAQALGLPVIVGVHTGIDADKARMVATLRGAREQSLFNRLADSFSRASLGWPPGQLMRGVGWAARSYARPQLVPEGSVLLRVNPDISWWDFHRTAEALAAGRQSAQLQLAAGIPGLTRQSGATP